MAIADYNEVIGMTNAPVEQKARAMGQRSIAYWAMDPAKKQEAINNLQAALQVEGVPDDIRLLAQENLNAIQGD